MRLRVKVTTKDLVIRQIKTVKRPLFLVFLFLGSCLQSSRFKTVGPLTLPSKTQAGREVKLEYDRSKSVLSKEKGFNITLYYVIEDRIYAIPVPISKDSGNIVHAAFYLPDSAQAYGLKFAAVHTDTGRYTFPVYNSAGKPVAGALAAESMFYIFRGSFVLRKHAIPGKALQLIKKDMEAHPEIKNYWQENFWKLLLNQKKQEAYPEVQKQMESWLRKDSLQQGDYHLAYELYQQMNKPKEADSINRIGIQKFPYGPLYQLSLKKAFIKQKSVEEKVVDFGKIKRLSDSLPQYDFSDLISFMAIRIAIQYEDEGDYPDFLKYASEIDNAQQLASMYNSTALRLVKKGTRLDLADSMSKMSLRLIQAAIDSPGTLKPTYLTGENWKDIMQRSYAMHADTYAQILAKQGKYQQAARYQKKAVAYLQNTDAQKNAHYVDYLIRLKDYRAAQQQLEKAFSLSKITPEMERSLKEVYVHLNRSEEGFENYRAQLQKKAIAQMKITLADKILHIPAKNFTLSDLNGKEVSLSGLRGKVVVLDFWAVWSEPSTNSFKGMQQAVQKFESDSNVIFLFINTLESASPEVRKKQITGFMTQNNYSFRILLDRPLKGETSQYQIARAYDVISVPTLFIINPKGMIQFKKTGFSGYTSNEVIEVSSMIDLVLHPGK